MDFLRTNTSEPNSAAIAMHRERAGLKEHHRIGFPRFSVLGKSLVEQDGCGGEGDMCQKVSRTGILITRPRSGKGFELCFFNLRPCPQLHSGG